MANDPKRQHFSMLRSYALADVFTLSNAACGTGAIFLCLNYLAERHTAYIWTAFALLPVAIVCDFLDGFVARKSGKSSLLGADLDSLADIVSFGVGPAVLGFTLGLRGGWDALILIYFVVCGISRLARYNVTAEQLADASGKVKYYEGTPIPTSLVIVILLAIAFALGHTGTHMWWGEVQLGPARLHPFTLIYGLSGSAMISESLKVPKP